MFLFGKEPAINSIIRFVVLYWIHLLKCIFDDDDDGGDLHIGISLALVWGVPVVTLYIYFGKRWCATILIPLIG